MIADVKIELVLTRLLLPCLSSYNGNDHPHYIRECLRGTIQGESSHEFRCEVRESVAVVTMDRPQKLNALTVDMRNALATAFEAAGVRPCGSLIGTDLKRLNDPSLKL